MKFLELGSGAMGVTLGMGVLTMGNRPAELLALLNSVEAQEGGDGGVRTAVLGQGIKLPSCSSKWTRWSCRGSWASSAIGTPAWSGCAGWAASTSWWS
ncbi:hypothetical protein GCM10009759_75030 [Kitasatospora saccharophila]|uniref:Uncharacterized protein n=1 Tax=Kitasatospora saccharophila TaxID=407973 RepID=A0ABN2Y9W9_9ACTN